MALDAPPRPEETKLGFDPDALREKYAQERAKRIRADGNDQYREAVGDFASYLDDPHVGVAYLFNPPRKSSAADVSAGPPSTEERG